MCRRDGCTPCRSRSWAPCCWSGANDAGVTFHTTRDVLGALKRGEAINYHTAWRDLLIALIILAAGAGVGPEASLMGAVIAYSVWQCDKLRYLHTHADSVRATPIPTRLRMLYHPTRWIEPATTTATAAEPASDSSGPADTASCDAAAPTATTTFTPAASETAPSASCRGASRCR